MFLFYCCCLLSCFISFYGSKTCLFSFSSKVSFESNKVVVRVGIVSIFIFIVTISFIHVCKDTHVFRRCPILLNEWSKQYFTNAIHHFKELTSWTFIPFSRMFSFLLVFENRGQWKWLQQVSGNSGDIRFYWGFYKVLKKRNINIVAIFPLTNWLVISLFLLRKTFSVSPVSMKWKIFHFTFYRSRLPFIKSDTRAVDECVTYVGSC